MNRSRDNGASHLCFKILWTSWNHIIGSLQTYGPCNYRLQRILVYTVSKLDTYRKRKMYDTGLNIFSLNLTRSHDTVIKLQLKIPPTRAAFYRRAMFYSYPIVKRLGIARTKDREVISRCFGEMTDLKNEGPIARRHYGTSTVNRRRPTDPTDELHWPNLHSIGVRQNYDDDHRWRSVLRSQ